MVQPLSKHCRVYAVDLRCHGDSGRPAWVSPDQSTQNWKPCWDIGKALDTYVYPLTVQ